MNFEDKLPFAWNC